MTTPLAIDPVGCGCTECLVGEYVPIERATSEQVLALAKGEIGDNTSQIAHVQYERDGISIILGHRTFDYPSLGIDDLPPSSLGFELVRVTFDHEAFEQIKAFI